MREKELQRDYEQDINEHFGGKQLLKVKEVAEYTGLDAGTVRENLPFKKYGRNYYISAKKLARALS